MLHERLLFVAGAVGVETGEAVPENEGKAGLLPPADMTGGASANDAGKDDTAGAGAAGAGAWFCAAVGLAAAACVAMVLGCAVTVTVMTD